MICKNCGAEVPNWKFNCENCGAFMDDETESADEESVVLEQPSQEKGKTKKKGAKTESTGVSMKTSAKSSKKAAKSAGKSKNSLILVGVISGVAVLVFIIVTVAVQSKRNKERLAAIQNEAAAAAEADSVAEDGTEAGDASLEQAEENADSENNAQTGTESETGPADEASGTGALSPFYRIFSKDPQVTETLLWDGALRINATGIEYSEGDGSDPAVRLLLHIENTSDETLCISQGGWCAVNGYMIGDYADAETGDVPAGGSVDGALTIPMRELKKLGITHISRIQGQFEIDRSGEDYIDYYADTEPFSVNTTDSKEDDLTKSLAGRLGDLAGMPDSDFRIDYSAEEILADRDGIRVVSEAAIRQNENGREKQIIYLELENNTDQSIFIRTYNFCVNELMVTDDADDYYKMAPGCRAAAVYDMDQFIDNPVISELFGVKEAGRVSMRLGYGVAGDYADTMYLLADTGFTINNQIGNFIIKGSEIYNANGISIYSAGYVSNEDPVRGRGIYFAYAVNNNIGEDIVINASDGIINGDPGILAHAENEAVTIPAACNCLISFDTFGASDIAGDSGDTDVANASDDTDASAQSNDTEASDSSSASDTKLPDAVSSFEAVVRISDKNDNTIDEPSLLATY